MKKTQRDWVRSILLKEGSISRNYCLANYISRLGAIICLLKIEGMDIGGKIEGKDYVYTLLNRHPKILWEIDRERNIAIPRHE